ncbi:MAG: hypothetical protein LCH20_00050 [Proteobacteria bacterium]|nr:hypothetical protein [Pseudomonadota bacterium]
MENLDTVCKPKTKWLTKDRFWNFVFWFGMSTFWTIAAIMAQAKIPTLPGIVVLISLIVFPVAVSVCNGTTFVKDTIFKNSEGIEFNTAKRAPNVLLLILSTFGLTALTGLFLDAHKEIPDALSAFIGFNVMFGVPSLFFIFKNCPISILFNRKTWQLRAMTDEEYLAMRRRDDSMTNPACSSFSGNIYHNSHRHY